MRQTLYSFLDCKCYRKGTHFFLNWGHTTFRKVLISDNVA